MHGVGWRAGGWAVQLGDVLCMGLSCLSLFLATLLVGVAEAEVMEPGHCCLHGACMALACAI